MLLRVSSLFVMLGACTEQLPDVPVQPIGPGQTTVGEECRFRTWSYDPDGEDVYIRFDWCDGDTTDWGLMPDTASYFDRWHAWDVPGMYLIRAQARDIDGQHTDWSGGEILVVH